MSDIAALEARLSSLDTNFSAMKSALDRMADAITKLAVLEERGTNAARDIQWCHKRLDDLAVRVQALEEENIRTKAVVATLGKTARVLWIVFGGAAVMAASALARLTVMGGV